MTKEQLDALFAMQAAFPNMDKHIGTGGVLNIQIWLTSSQVNFWNAAQSMMEPLD